jgi:S1/P1 Nuclease
MILSGLVWMFAYACDIQARLKISNHNMRNTIRAGLATTVGFLILLTPSLSLGWGAGGHMMTAAIAYERLNPRAKAKVDELLAIQIYPAGISAQSPDFINASHWADDIKSVKELDFLSPQHYINLTFTDDGTPLPADLPAPENIVKALADNVKILKTSPDKNAQALALRLIIHFVGDTHQPLHASTRVSHALPHGDQGGNLVNLKMPQPDGSFKNVKLHSYWDGGIETFPRSGPPPTYTPPSLSEIGPAMAKAKQGNPASAPGLKLKQPFNFKLWADESFALSKTVAYKGISEGTTPSAEYKAAAIKTARQRVAWGGYRLAALLNAIWP